MVSYAPILVGVGFTKDGLNPYCSGQWSRTVYNNVKIDNFDTVLILIVVDNGLVLSEKMLNNKPYGVLILIVVDNGLVLDLIRHY